MGGAATKQVAAKYTADSLAGPITIYFATATGKSNGFAKDLSAELNSLGFEANIINVSEYDPDSLLNCRLALFLLSTSGEGASPFMARTFTEWIENKNALQRIPSNALKSLHYSVFALGNREYRTFCRYGKEVDGHLRKLGACQLMEVGVGDDSGTLEEDFIRWKHAIINKLMVKYHPHHDQLGYHENVSTTGGPLVIPSRVKLDYRVTTIPSDEAANLPKRSGEEINMNSSSKYFFTAATATVTCNRDLKSSVDPKEPLTDIAFICSRSTNDSSTHHIEISLKDTNIKYQTADNVAILPKNCLNAVNKMASALNYNISDMVKCIPRPMSMKSPKKSKSNKNGAAFVPQAMVEPFPTPCSVGSILENYLDITGVPSQSLLLQLHPYLTNSQQRQWLINLLKMDNYKQYMRENRICIADLLANQLSSAVIPLSDLINIVPFQRPRYYTICSSSSIYPESLHLCVAWLADSNGVCSSYMKGLIPGTTCRLFVQPSSFRLPVDITIPITMVGPGTGIAPMRALLQERWYQSIHGNTQLDNNINSAHGHSAHVTSELIDVNGSFKSIVVGRNTLYFGCKSSKQDYIYKDELAEFVKNGTLNDLHLAFSREDANKKVYVQHLLQEKANALALVDSLNKGGYIYVCGATAMGNEVRIAIVTVLMEHLFMSMDNAQALIQKWQDTGRFVEELWTG